MPYKIKISKKKFKLKKVFSSKKVNLSKIMVGCLNFCKDEIFKKNLRYDFSLFIEAVAEKIEAWITLLKIFRCQ